MYKININQSNVLNTKYGRAKIDNCHYRITTRKEGNHGKYLHRLIFEDFYGPIPKGYEIHHDDKNPLNNCIMNLKLMSRSDHRSLHHKDKEVSLETRRKMSENHPDISGENHPMYGKTRSLETRKKISETLKGNKFHK